MQAMNFTFWPRRPLPEAGRYDGYIQLENGVGMLRLLAEEVREALAEEMPEPVKAGTVSVATGLWPTPISAGSRSGCGSASLSGSSGSTR